MSHSSWIGKKLGGRYEIVSELGSGGMSTVYKANDPNLGRVVAIKIIHHHLTTNEDFVRRFRDEAAVVAQLRHPNIVQVYDFNSDDDVYFIVFEFVPGVTLQDHLKRLNELQRRVSVDEIIKYTQQIGSALDYAHGRGLVHRDIKPANVMINVYGDAILTDFGIAKIMDSTHHTATGAVLGTARYMSPEQIKGQTVDGRSDTYSLGVMLYEMASGFPPYDAESVMTILMMHVNDPIPRLPKLDLPGGLNDCIETAMAKEPEDRYQTLAELSADLNRLDELDRFDHTAQEKTEDISNTIAYQSIPQVGDPAVDSTMVDQPTVPSGGTGVTTGRLPAQPVTPAGQTVDGGDGDRSLFRSPLVWLGGGIAAILLVGLIFMAGRLSGGGGTNVEAMTPQAVSGQSAAPDDEEAEP
ncbi:MAG: protein kinase, partial [Chloroflexota bacterium]